MVHERLDLDKWVKKFPIERMDRATDVSTSLTGPLPVAYIEQMRSAVQKAGGCLGKPVPLDLCVWKLGESARREISKVGGVPYWPSSEPWPMYGAGKKYTFVAQFCFVDSRDILPKLPGDLLSILAATSDYTDIEIRWFKLEQAELLPAERIPAPQWGIYPCHAVLHRTAEYPEANYKLFDQYPYPLNLWARKLKDGSKLGGVWELRGELPDPAEIHDARLRREIQKAWDEVRQQERSFICQLGSIQATRRQPLINVDDKGSLPTRQAKRFLMIADVGGYDFFYNGKETTFSWWSG